MCNNHLSPADRTRIMYEILGLKYPKGYRTAAGARSMVKLQGMECDDLRNELKKWQDKAAQRTQKPSWVK